MLAGFQGSLSQLQAEKVQDRAGSGKSDSRNGQTVILAAGSTVVEVARRLIDRSIQIITNSIPVAQISGIAGRPRSRSQEAYLYPASVFNWVRSASACCTAFLRRRHHGIRG